jgi:FG-GAP repeat
MSLSIRGPTGAPFSSHVACHREPRSVRRATCAIAALCSAGTLDLPATAQSLLWESWGVQVSQSFIPWSAVGDVDNDGINDLLVAEASFKLPGGLISIGRVVVVSGSTGAVVAQVFHPPPQEGTGFGGHSVAAVGDVNGNGTPDFAVGAPFADMPDQTTGSVTVFDGADRSVIHQWVGQTNEGYGRWITGLGDVDLDGVPDLACSKTFGATPIHVRSGQSGAVLVQLGPPPGYSFYGSIFNGLGDVSGDGELDLAVGMSKSGGKGRVDVYTAATGVLQYSIEDRQFSSSGGAPYRAGDVNGDGFSDLSVGYAFGEVISGTRTYLGPTGTFLWGLETYQLEKISSGVGGSDFNGDGYDDILVGAPNYKSPYTPEIWSGRLQALSGIDGTPIFEVVGFNEKLGIGYVHMGDITGDGFPDFAVGSRGSIGMCGNPPVPMPACPGRVKMYSGAPAGVRSFGHGCGGGSGAPPTVGTTWTPVIGKPFAMHLSQTKAPAQSLLALGSSDKTWGGIRLPFALDFIGLNGCELFAAADALLPVATTPLGSGLGHASMSWLVPNNSTLVGERLYGQWYVADPTPGVPAGAMSRAVELTLQPASLP